MRDPEQAVQRLRNQLHKEDREIDCDSDRDALLAFSDQLALRRETYGHHRHEKLLRQCVRIAEHGPASIAAALEDREAAEAIVRWIRDKYDPDETPETNQGYRVALRVFGRRATDGDELPPSIAWVKTTLPRSYDPSPDPGTMLEWPDIEALLDACHYARERAAIAVQFDAGLRGSELHSLTVDDITDVQHGKSVRVDGKTGERSVLLIPSTPYLQRWLDDHPGSAEDPLWSQLHEPEPLSYNAFLQLFKEPAARTDVEKPVTPTNLRKSNLAWLVRRGMNARSIEQRQGRAHGSDAVSRYVALFDADVGEEYARLMGKEVEKESVEDRFGIQVCPRCRKETPLSREQCVWCWKDLENDEDDAGIKKIELVQLLSEHPELIEPITELNEAIKDVPGYEIRFEGTE